MKTVTQILPLEAMTVNNPSDSSRVTVGAIAGSIARSVAGVTVGELID